MREPRPEPGSGAPDAGVTRVTAAEAEAAETGTSRDVFQYSVVRVVPRVERGEQLNVGVILLCRARRYLGARVVLDEARVRAFAPDLDLDAIRPHLDAIERIAAGDPSAGPIARLDAAERFHWLVSPASTIIQPSEVHTGLADDPARELEALVEKLVR